MISKTVDQTQKSCLKEKLFRICTTLLLVSGPNDKDKLYKCIHVGHLLAANLLEKLPKFGTIRELQMMPLHRSTKANLSFRGYGQRKSLHISIQFPL